MKRFLLRLRLWFLEGHMAGIEANESLGPEEIANATHDLRERIAALKVLCEGVKR